MISVGEEASRPCTNYLGEKQNLFPCAASAVPVHVRGCPGLGAKSLDVGRAEAGHNAGITGGVRIDAELGLAWSSRSGRRRP